MQVQFGHRHFLSIVLLLEARQARGNASGRQGEEGRYGPKIPGSMIENDRIMIQPNNLQRAVQ
jgi:hypothetical protein